MKIAIVLRGFIQRNNSSFIDEFKYTKTQESFNKSIVEGLEKLGWDYDIYASVKSNDSPIDEADFISKFNVNKFKFNKDTSQFDDYLTGLKMVADSQIQYDLILVTHVDLIYHLDLSIWNINVEKFNCCWKEPMNDPKDWVCDVIHFFNAKYLTSVIEILSSDAAKFSGDYYYGQTTFYRTLIEKIGIDSIHFITNDKYFSGTFWNNPFCNNPMYIIWGYKNFFHNYTVQK